MVDILEDIARQATNQAARIAAITQLRDMRKHKAEERPERDEFDDLAQRRSDRLGST